MGFEEGRRVGYEDRAVITHDPNIAIHAFGIPSNQGRFLYQSWNAQPVTTCDPNIPINALGIPLTINYEISPDPLVDLAQLPAPIVQSVHQLGSQDSLFAAEEEVSEEEIPGLLSDSDVDDDAPLLSQAKHFGCKLDAGQMHRCDTLSDSESSDDDHFEIDDRDHFEIDDRDHFEIDDRLGGDDGAHPESDDDLEDLDDFPSKADNVVAPALAYVPTSANLSSVIAETRTRIYQAERSLEGLSPIIARLFQLFPSDPNSFANVLGCCTRTLVVDDFGHLLVMECILQEYALLSNQHRVQFGDPDRSGHPVLYAIFALQQAETLRSGCDVLDGARVKKLLDQFDELPDLATMTSKLPLSLVEMILEQCAPQHWLAETETQLQAEQYWSEVIDAILSNCDSLYALRVMIRFAQIAQSKGKLHLILAIATSPFGAVFQQIHHLI